MNTHICHRFLPASPAPHPSEVKGFCLRHKHTRTKRKQKQQNTGSWKVKELKQFWEKHRNKLLWATKPQKGLGTERLHIPLKVGIGEGRDGVGGGGLKTEGLVECPYESTLSLSQPSTQRIRAIAPPQPSRNQMGGFSHL